MAAREPRESVELWRLLQIRSAVTAASLTQGGNET